VGFDVRLSEKLNDASIFDHTASTDLLKYGLIPELIGRLPIICTLHELSEEALIEILTKPKNAICKQYQKYFDMDGVKLNFTDDALKEIAKIAISQKTGARGLRSIMEKMMLGIMYDLPDRPEIATCTISPEVVKNSKEPVLTFKEKDKKKAAN
ncbi:MAG: ATP-dependent Clp protease ATP-binding subunit ClpX, partial [Candidatus Cloacimonadaceae bacterium]